MGRGILTGLIWGTIVGFGILTVANEIVAPVEVAPESALETAPKTAPEMAPETAIATPEPGAADIVSPTVEPEGEAGSEPATATLSEAAPEPEELSAPDAPETPAAEGPAMDVTAESPAAEPDRSGSMEEVAAPEAEVETMPAADTTAAAAPEIERPVAPETPAGEEAMGEVNTPETSPILAPPLGMAPEAGASDTLPAAEESLPAPVPLPEGADMAPEAPESPAMQEAPMTPEAAGTVPAQPLPKVSKGLPKSTLPKTAEGDSTLDTADMEAAPGATLDQGPAPETMPGKKVGSFTDRADDLMSSRLPTVGAKTATDEAAPMVAADDLPALLAYSADFDKTPAGPVMSVILVDIAKLSPEDPELSNLPFPVTFAVDALATRAGERAMAYRDKGLEVLSMISLPEGATPQDAAVTLEQAESLVPVSIGFLDVPSGTFQASRQVAAQVVATAQESGRGLVSFPRGLNAMEQEAQRAKAPAALVFRDFDGRGQDVAAMKRFLDQAAFQAGTGKQVVLLGRSKPDTIQALAEWSLGNRATTVTMVPLSYLLSRSQL